MATFSYVALDASGRQTTGTIPADNRRAAMDAVMGRGLSPIKMEEKAGKSGEATHASNGGGLFGGNPNSTRVPQSAVEAFTREMANLLAAGLPLARALHLLRREASHPGAKNVWNAIHE